MDFEGLVSSLNEQGFLLKKGAKLYQLQTDWTLTTAALSQVFTPENTRRPYNKSKFGQQSAVLTPHSDPGAPVHPHGLPKVPLEYSSITEHYIILLFIIIITFWGLCIKQVAIYIPAVCKRLVNQPAMILWTTVKNCRWWHTVHVVMLLDTISCPV